MEGWLGTGVLVPRARKAIIHLNGSLVAEKPVVRVTAEQEWWKRQEKRGYGLQAVGGRVTGGG